MKLIITLLGLIIYAYGYDCVVGQEFNGLPKCEGPVINPRHCKFYHSDGKIHNEFSSFRFQEIWSSNPDGNLPLCTSFGKRSEACELSINSSSTNFKYDGTDAFCQAYQICQESGVITCVCDIGELTSKLYVLSSDGEWEMVTNQTTLMCADRDPDAVSLQNGRQLLAYNDVINTQTEPVLYKLVNDKLIINFLNSADRFVLINKEMFSQFFHTNKTEFTFVLPEMITLKSGYLHLQIYDSSNNLIFSADIYYLATYTCRLKDCLFCWDAFNNWSCLPTIHQVFIIFLLTLIGLLIACFSPFAALGLLATIKLLYKLFIRAPFRIFRKLFMMSYNSRMASKLKNVGSSVKELVKDDVPELEIKPKQIDDLDALLAEEERINRELRRKRGGKVKPSSLFSSFLIICICSPIAFACDSTVLGTATYYHCHPPSSLELARGTQTCDLQFSLTASLPNINSKLCLDIRSPSDNSTIIKSLNFTYVEMKEYVNVATDYVTSAWTGLSQTSYRCYGVSTCDSASDCDNVNTYQHRDAYGELSGDVTLYPGRVSCRRSVSCGLNPCFLCEPGCLYTGIALKPTGDVFSVYRPVSVRKEPKLRICHREFGLTEFFDECQDITQSSGSVITGSGSGFPIKTQIIGSLVGDTTIFGTNKIVTKPFQQRIMPAAEPNAPVGGGLGDIQGNLGTFLTATWTAFIYATGLWSISQSTTFDMVSFVFPGSYTYGSVGAGLPGLYGGNLYSWNSGSGQLIGINSNPGALVVNIQTSGNLTFSQQVLWTCPSANFVSASGCYSCTVGASVVLRIKSTCHEGLVTFTDDADYVTLQTTSATISTSDIDVIINLLTTQANNNFNIKIKGSGGETEVFVGFVAVFLNQIQNQTQQNSTTDIKNNIGGLSDSVNGLSKFTDFFTETIPEFFDDVFKGTASWWEYMIFAIFIVVAIFIALFIARPALIAIKSLILKLKDSWNSGKNFLRKKNQ